MGAPALLILSIRGLNFVPSSTTLKTRDKETVHFTDELVSHQQQVWGRIGVGYNQAPPATSQVERVCFALRMLAGPVAQPPWNGSMSPASETMRASQEMQGTSYISNGLVSTIRLLWSRWPLLLVCALLGVAASVTAAVLMKPVYRATTVLSPVSQDRAATRGLLGELAGFAAAAGVDVGSDNGSVEESLAVFRSRRFTESFIADL